MIALPFAAKMQMHSKLTQLISIHIKRAVRVLLPFYVHPHLSLLRLATSNVSNSDCDLICANHSVIKGFYGVSTIHFSIFDETIMMMLSLYC